MADKYLSIDLESTGLNENDYIIEFAAVPFSTQEKTVETSLTFHKIIKCPSYEDLQAHLSSWVKKNNKRAIRKAYEKGIEIDHLKSDLSEYLESQSIREYFGLKKKEKIVLCGKSLNAIDLPFLSRDLGWDYIRHYFHHQVLDISSTAHYMIDSGQLPPGCAVGGELMKHFHMGEVCHTALEDAVHVAKLHMLMVEQIKNGTP